jgi:hypothetical protein
MRLLNFAIATSVVFFLGSCKSREFNMSGTNARVTQPQFDQALDILSKSLLMTDGIPFQFAEDGCFARALLMGALLASEGIPSSSHFVFSERPSKSERGGTSDPRFYVAKSEGRVIRWAYHVAPLLKPPEGPAIIFDPSLFGAARSKFTV